jgi:hypothetical protein
VIAGTWTARPPWVEWQLLRVHVAPFNIEGARYVYRGSSCIPSDAMEYGKNRSMAFAEESATVIHGSLTGQGRSC